MHEDEVDIDSALVRRLLADQMPELAREVLEVVEPWGTDTAIWRIGDDLVVRLPRIHWAADQVDSDARWLPRLAPFLPVQIPEPIAVGEPAFGYPYRWALHRWIPGQGAAPDRLDDPVGFACDLAEVVRSLQSVSIDGAPPARNRARPLQDYDNTTRAAIARAGHLIDAEVAARVWEDALAAPPHGGPSVWVQGDLDGNCLVRDGRLCGIVDWGLACSGDPAADVQVVWSLLFTDESRRAFLDLLRVDDATLARSRGAALSQAVNAVTYYLHTYPLIVERSWHKLAALGVPALDKRSEGELDRSRRP
jgi:aminoglycoside phosphotransferase (APT) family kinase protein